jgi:hypothetical protein
MSDIILVGCVAQKTSRMNAAKDLYTSALFKKRRAYAEATGKPWFILSALHGLLSPDQRVIPYDFTIDRMGPVALRRWAFKALYDLDLRVGTESNLLVEVHAGAPYFKPLHRAAQGHGGFTLLHPVRGLQIGEQLAWYGRQP